MSTVFVSYHVLHTDADLPIAVKGPIEAHNVRGVAFMQHLQLSDNLVPYGGLDFKVDQLRGGGGNTTMKCRTDDGNRARHIIRLGYKMKQSRRCGWLA